MRLVGVNLPAIAILLIAASPMFAQWPERRLPIVIQSGPGGSPAMEFTASAEPDGYTIMIVAASLTVNPSLKSVPNSRDSFAFLFQEVASPKMLVTNSKDPTRTLNVKGA